MRLVAVAAALVAWTGCDLDQSIGAHDGTCGTCHVKHADELAESAHASSGSTPLYVALRDEMGTDAVLCDTCHLPAVGTESGLSCATCHAAHGNFEPGNGALAWDLDGPVRGPFDDPHEARPHAAVQGGFVTDSELCGTCHDQDRLGAFEESPWRHWRESPAAADGVRCQDCHMSPEPGAAVERERGPLVPGLDGLPERPLSSHRFVGIGSESDPDQAVALLRRSVALEAWDEGPDRVVRITNLGRGHHLPDGASFLRELWLGTDTDRRWLSASLLDIDGNEVVSPADATTVEPRGLPPGASRTERFENLAGTEICLHYRPLRADLAAHLALPIPPSTPVACP